MATVDYEAGLKKLEELTTNAPQIQDQLLIDILTKNSETEYLTQFLHGETDKQLFKKSVPIITYEDIKPYVDRIANGEASSRILSAEPITWFSLRHQTSLICFALLCFSIGFSPCFLLDSSSCLIIVCLFFSSGTSGGQPKLIPVTAENANITAVFGTLYRSVMIKHVGDINQVGKRMEFMFAKPEIETPSGLTASALSTRSFKGSAFRAILPKLYTSPFETIVCPDTKQSMYCQILFGLIQRDEVVMIGSIFASGVLRGLKFLENNWQELCSNIKTGQLSDWITDSGCRNAASLILKPNPELADSIENICSCKSWEGIVTKLWPKTKYIGAICTGAMIQYTAELEFYCRGLPLVSGFYACSEGSVAINLEPLSKPSDVSYTFLPHSVYYEFLPINEECVTDSQNQDQSSGVSHNESIETKNNNEDTEAVDLANVKLGKCYEVLVTSSAGLYRYRVGDVIMVSGFHNNTPQFQFVGRQNVVLHVDLERTSEADLIKAVAEAKSLLDPHGLILTEYTSYGDTSSTPGHYVIFWELRAKESNDCKELDPKVMEECCSKLEDSLNFTYRMYRKENIIAALEIRVVKQGTFDALMDYFVSRGTTMSQYKRPICIKSKEALELLDSRVVGKFFSPRSPI